MPYIATKNSRIELNATALAQNIAYFKRIVQTAELGIVVKGNAYGHGLDEIVALTKNNAAVAWYFTASLSEALHMRSLGITKPILVMSIIDEDPLLAFKHNIRLAFYQYEQFDDLERAKHLNLRPIIHLKIDTGLTRFGFTPEQGIRIAHKLHAMPHVFLEGLFTHFAKAEIRDQSYTDLQISRFTAVYAALSRTLHIPYRHAHATSATLWRGHEDSNLFRIGAGLYGLWPTHELQTHTTCDNRLTLTQVLTWKTHIIHIKTVPAGTPVGYGCSYVTPQPMRLAFLPVGYADGYNRNLSNRATVYIGNCLAPIIGKIGMNCITVDISAIPHASIGTEVLLTGPHLGITALDLACAAGGMNPREITTSINTQLRIIRN